MIKRIAVTWNETNLRGNVKLSGGSLLNVKQYTSSDYPSELTLAFTLDTEMRLELVIETTDDSVLSPGIVTIESTNHTFSFFLKDVNSDYPIFIPAYEVAVTSFEDKRSYEQIKQAILEQGLLTNLQKLNDEPEECYETAASHTRDLPSQTWLGMSRDIRIFSMGYRGIDGEERLWDWVQPRFHGIETPLPEFEDKAVCYRFMLGRGIGCSEQITRRLDEGILPILHASIADDDIVYNCTSFVSYENSRLSAETLRGTHFLVADGYGHGHMFTPKQTEQREMLLNEEMNQEEETVFYFRCEAVNRTRVPRYAWFKNIVPNAYVLNNTQNYTFDRHTGFVEYSKDRVCGVSKLNGKPLTQEETAILIKPGESAVFEFYLPHRPISSSRAKRLIAQSFLDKLEECRIFWKHKLSQAAQINVPEQRINEMIKAGLLHLELVNYGLEPSGTLVPTIGVYTAIGSESAPIIQFFDSMGLAETAKRSLMFFLDKQHDNGFIQNYGGYMLETGAALWSIGEHYRYTRDESWLSEIKSQLLNAYKYLLEWRERNRKEELRGKGYGMLEGKTADPDDLFHSFMLNGYAYIGMSRLGELLAATDQQLSEEIMKQAEAFKADIRKEFFDVIGRSPVVPLGDGSWVPTSPPWVEHRGPLSLYSEDGRWMTHGSFVARDSLLGPLYLIFQEVVDPHEKEAEFLLQYHNELMCSRNVALSQPYYSIHPWVHLIRGEVKAFLKAYYNGFSGLADRETYTFWEHYFHASPHKTHEEGWFLMQTRWMLYMEEGSLLKLLPGIPRKWMEDGKKIELDQVATYFGLLSLKVESVLSEGKITANIYCSNTDSLPNSIKLRLPHPEGRFPTAVTGGSYNQSQECVLVDKFNGRAEITLIF